MAFGTVTSIADNSSPRILITDFVYPTKEPEREVFAEISAEVGASEGSEDTLAVDYDGIMTCFAQVTPVVVGRLNGVGL